MAFGIWLLSASNKAEMPGMAERFNQRHVLPSIVLMGVTILMLIGGSILQYILDHTETPCEKAWEARKERKIHAAEAEQHSDEEDDALLSFTEAFTLEEGKKGAFLAGALTSYAIQDNPIYADAFEHIENSEYGAKMEAKREAMKTPRGDHPSPAAIMAEAVAGAEGPPQADSEDPVPAAVPVPPKLEKPDGGHERKQPLPPALPPLGKPGKLPSLPPLGSIGGKVPNLPKLEIPQP